MKSDRIIEMEKYICQNGSATMEELCGQFDVSMNTVRRDVAQLIKRGSVEKVYGGVCARQSAPSLTPYEVRRIKNEDAKIKVGQRAAELVRDGDVIFVDSGTTTLQLIDHLSGIRELTIVTNNLEAVVRALPYEQINVIMLPGRLRRKTNSFTGEDTVRALKRYNIRIAFMAATGVSVHGVTNSSPQEYEIKKNAIESCECSVLMIAADKFDFTGLMTYAQLGDFDYVVTDRMPSPIYSAAFEKGKSELLIAGKK